MKTNLPVSGRAVEFGANANILSTTNPKGAISYLNPDFVNISGQQQLRDPAATGGNRPGGQRNNPDGQQCAGSGAQRPAHRKRREPGQ